MENETPEHAPIETSTTPPAAASESGAFVAPADSHAEPPGNTSALARKEGLWALGIGLFYLLFWQIVPRIRNDSVVVILTTTLLSLAITLLFTVRTARALRSPLALGVCLTVSTMLVLPSALPTLVHAFPLWPIWGTLAPFYRSYRQAYHAVPGLDGLLLILLAVSLGTLVSRLVREFKMLLPMAVVLALVDLYVVFGGGLVTQAQSGKSQVAQEAMKALTVQLPTAQPKSGAAPLSLIGFADFLFIALFFACFTRFGIPSRNTFLVLCGLLMAYMLTVFLTNISLPALVPIAVVVISMNLRRFRYERSEAFALLYASLFLLALAGAFYFLSHKR
ncbi:MAG TPA: hypothetical protein VKU00_21515 [Chthonomonadaceae bacterium]|nr:hypothetical protein [Chthonomonadaceae bacterium]